MVCVIRIAIVFLGSLLWLEMVRFGVVRVGGKKGFGVWRFLVLFSFYFFRSEDWSLFAGWENVKGYL